MIITNLEKFFESRSKSKSDEIVSLVFKILESKPKISLSNGEVEKGIYSISGIKKYFVDNGKTKGDADEAMHQIFKDKNHTSKIERVSVKNYEWNENIPHYYVGMDKSSVEDLKKEKENLSQEKGKEKLRQRQDLKKVARASIKNTRKPSKTTEKKKK